MAILKRDKNLADNLKEQINNSGLKTKYELPEAENDKNYAFSVNFPKRHKEILERYFREKGLSFSSGIRMIIYEYMKENEIK